MSSAKKGGEGESGLLGYASEGDAGKRSIMDLELGSSQHIERRSSLSVSLSACLSGGIRVCVCLYVCMCVFRVCLCVCACMYVVMGDTRAVRPYLRESASIGGFSVSRFCV